MTAWVGLAALLALAAHAFVREGLFGQSPVWYPEGWRRLALFAAAFAVWIAVVSLRWRDHFPGITCAAMLALAVAALGPAAVGAVVLFLLASMTVGRVAGASDNGIAVLCGLGVYMFAAYGLVHLPVNHWFTWLTLLVVPIVVCPGETRAAIRTIAEAGRGGSSLHIAITFMLTLHWIVAAKPDVSSDGLAMHLAIPAKAAQLRYWPFDAGHTAWAVMPMGADWCYMIVYLLGGEYAARLLNFALALVTVALVYRAARHWLSGPRALWIVLLYVSSPMMHLVTGNLFVETFWAALAFGGMLALWRFEESGDRGDLFRTAWILGCAGMVKLGAMAFIAASVPFLILSIRRRRPTGSWIAGLLLAVPASIPYLIAFRVTGNPVFPFLAPSPARPSFDYWYDLAFRTSRWLESQNGAFGFQYFLLAPLALLLIRRNWRFREWSALGIGVISTALIVRAQPNARYLFPAQAFLSVLIAIAMARVPRLVAVAALCVALNAYFLPMSSYSNKGFAVNMFSREDVDGFLRGGAPVRDLVTRMNRTHPGEAALFIGNPQIAGFEGRAYTNSWHHQTFLDKLEHANSEPALRALFNAERIRLFVAPVRGEGGFIDHVPLESFLDRWTTPGPRNGAWYVAVLSDSARPMPGPVPLGRGRYDDTEQRIRYEGAWRRDTQFAEAAHRTLVYSNEPGSAVRFEFEGPAFRWIHTRAANRGRATVSIDGAPGIEVDLHSTETRWRQELRFSAAPGRHKVEIRNLDARYIDTDAIEIE